MRFSHLPDEQRIRALYERVVHQEMLEAYRRELVGTRHVFTTEEGCVEYWVDRIEENELMVCLVRSLVVPDALHRVVMVSLYDFLSSC